MSNRFGDDCEDTRTRVLLELRTMCEMRLNRYGYDPDSYMLSVSVTPIGAEAESEPEPKPIPGELCPSDGA